MLRGALSGASYFSAVLDAAVVREDLVSQDETRQLAALQHIVAYMAAGKDMSNLFNEVAALTSTSSMRMKRLTYLYLVQNSHLQSEKAVLQAGALVKDTLSNSPLLRGAALRTMTRLHVTAMADFATAPLLRCLGDGDAYVRRAAVYGLLKQYATSSAVCVASSVLTQLPTALRDAHASVVAAAAQVLCELHTRRCRAIDCVAMLHDARPRLRAALRTATSEWAMWALLEALAHTLAHTPSSSSATATATRSTTTDTRHMTAVRRQRRQQASDTPQARHRPRTTRDDDNNNKDEDESDEDTDDGDEAVVQCALPFLSSANTAVTMAAARVVVLYLERTRHRSSDDGDEDGDDAAHARGDAHTATDTAAMATPPSQRRRRWQYARAVMRALVSLVTAAPRYEMRYAALQHVTRLVADEQQQQQQQQQQDANEQQQQQQQQQDMPYDGTSSMPPPPRTTALWRTLAQAHVGAFLLLHDDPDYVKRAKLHLLVALASDANATQVLREVRMCVAERDAALVKQSIHALGSLAVSLPSHAALCVRELERLVRSAVPHVVEHTAVVVRRILQRYGSQHRHLVTALCAALSVLRDEDAKVSAVWVLGSYAAQIRRVMPDYLMLFVDDLPAQPVLVQLAVVTALAKIVAYTRLGSSSARHDSNNNNNNNNEHKDTNNNNDDSDGDDDDDNRSTLTTSDAHAALQQLQHVAATAQDHDVRDRALFYVRLLAAAEVDTTVLHGIVDTYSTRSDSDNDNDGSNEAVRQTRATAHNAVAAAAARRGRVRNMSPRLHHRGAAQRGGRLLQQQQQRQRHLSTAATCFDQIALLLHTPTHDELPVVPVDDDDDDDDRTAAEAAFVHDDSDRDSGDVTALQSDRGGHARNDNDNNNNDDDGRAASGPAAMPQRKGTASQHVDMRNDTTAAVAHAQNNNNNNNNNDDEGNTAFVPSLALAAATPAVATRNGQARRTDAYTTVLHAASASGVEVGMAWSQQGTQLVLRAALQLRDGDDYVHSTRVTDMQVNRNAFGLGVAHAFVPVTIARDDADAAVHVTLTLSSNHATRPTHDIEVAIQLEYIGVRYCVAPPVPPSMLLLPATHCTVAQYITLLHTLPQPAWQLPSQHTPLSYAPQALAANRLRVHDITLVHRYTLTASTTTTTTDDASTYNGSDTHDVHAPATQAYSLYAETIARNKLLVTVLTNDNDHTIASVSVRCTYAPVAAYFGDYLVKCIQA